MKVSEILKATNGILLSGNTNDKIDNFSIDSRKITKDEMFIAIKGEKFDGNDFVLDVLNKESMGVIYDSNVNIDLKKYDKKIIIKVKNSLESLQNLAAYKRSLYNIPVVAITGSVGKTSTKDIIASVMKEKYNVLKTEGNLNNHIGLPLTLLKLKDHTAMCIEMGMNHFKEISLLTNILKPTIAVITNIGTAHIGNLGSRENILKAKLEILEGLNEEKNVIINNDNDLLHKWYIENKVYDVTTYGIKTGSNYMAYDINYDLNSSNYKIKLDDKIYECTILVPGEHFVLNSLCAIAVGKKLNINNNSIIKGIKEFELSKNRMEYIKLKNDVTLISDCYNANYDSMKSSIEILGKNKRRKVAVLGDMLELGKYSKDLHSKIGKVLSDNNIDVLIAVGEESEYIYNNTDIKCKYKCKGNDEAIDRLKKLINPGDIVLVKASNGMNFNEIVNNLKKI